MLDKRLIKIMKKKPLTPVCSLVFNCLGEAIRSHGVKPVPELKGLGIKKVVSVDDWRKLIYKHPFFIVSSSTRAAKSARFNKIRVQLILDGYIGQYENFVWVL